MREFEVTHCGNVMQCTLAFHNYEKYDGDKPNLAVVLMRKNEGGFWEEYVTLSVNVPSVEVSREYYLAKTYSENAGLNEQVAESGLVRTSPGIIDGFPMYRLTEEGIALRDECLAAAGEPPERGVINERLCDLFNSHPVTAVELFDSAISYLSHSDMVSMWESFKGEWEEFKNSDSED